MALLLGLDGSIWPEASSDGDAKEMLGVSETRRLREKSIYASKGRDEMDQWN